MSPSYLWVDREERSYPGGCFPLVNVPPDGPGDQVVDQEGHQERGRENWMGVVVEGSADVKLGDGDQVGDDVDSWQGDIEDGQEDGLLHLLEPCQHSISFLVLKSRKMDVPFK